MERNEKGNVLTQKQGGGDCVTDEDATLHGLPLAYAYVPVQRWRMLYSPEEALNKGTLFEELYKPMEVYGNE